MCTLNILLVEDSMPDLIKMLLEKMGYNARVARTVTGAKLILSQENIDAVVTDINLPGEMGTELLPELERKKIPVIVITAFMTFRDLRQRCFGYLEKPFKYEELHELLKVIDERKGE